MKIEDALATIINSITELTFKKISFFNSEKDCISRWRKKNLTLKMFLNNKFKDIVVTAEELGWEGDSIEAQAFAYLAVRSYLGLNITFPQTTGIKNSISGGVLHNYKLIN